MLVSALSSPHPRPGESSILNALFAAGLDQLHLRKPQQEARVTKNILDGIDPAYHNRIVLHDHFTLLRQYRLKGLHYRRSLLREGWLTDAARAGFRWKHRPSWTSASCFSLEQLEKAPKRIDHLWLSPAFTPISDPDAGRGFSAKRLEAVLGHLDRPVHAYGGIDAQTVLEARALGFTGIVLQGSLWKSKEPVKVLRSILTVLEKRLPAKPEPMLGHARTA